MVRNAKHNVMQASISCVDIPTRCIETFDGVHNKAASVAYVASTNLYWTTARFDRVAAFDPRAAANIAEYIQEPNQLYKHAVEFLYTPPGTDLVMAATKQRALVVRQHNSYAAHRCV